MESSDNSVSLQSESPTKKLKTSINTPCSSNFEIAIKDIRGISFSLNVNSNTTIKEIKDIIQDKEKCPPSRQRLIYNGKELQDNKSLNEYNLNNNSSSVITFHLIIKRGEGKDITTSCWDVITVKFIVNGFYKTYTLNKSVEICQLIKTIYNDCNLCQFGFPWSSWHCYIGYAYIPNTNYKLVGQYEISPGKHLSIKNNSWPDIPERDENFKQWLNGHDNNDEMPQSIVYPLCIMNGQYRMIQGDERLISSTLWLDIEVIKKLVHSNMIDINVKDGGHGWTPLNLLCAGNMPSNIKYDENEDKWLNMVSLFCMNNNIDLETRDDFNRSPLANAVRYDMHKIAKILLRFGACVDESVVKEIKEENYGSKQWLWKFLKSMKNDYVKELKDALSVYHCQNVLAFVLDYFLCPNSVYDDDESDEDVDVPLAHDIEF